MLAFTLTAFLELMDHGIVSWDLISLSFIKQVPPQPQGSFSRTSLHRLSAEIHGHFFSHFIHPLCLFFLLEVSGCCCQATAHIMRTWLLTVYEQLSLRERTLYPSLADVEFQKRICR